MKIEWNCNYLSTIDYCYHKLWYNKYNKFLLNNFAKQSKNTYICFNIHNINLNLYIREILIF